MNKLNKKNDNEELESPAFEDKEDDNKELARGKYIK